MIIGHVGVTLEPPLLSGRGGAIQRRVVELAKAQRAAGHEVVAVSVGPVAREQVHQGVLFDFLPCRTPLPLRHLEFQVRAIESLLARGVDVIHFHSQPEGAALVAGRVATVLSYDYFRFRGALGRALPGAYRLALRRFDQLLPCSRYCLEESERFWGLPRERTRVLYNGVDLSQFWPDPEAGARLRARLGIHGPVLLYVGRVCAQKGSDVLLEAFGMLRRSCPELELVFAGPIGQFDQTGDPQGWRRRIAAARAHYLGRVDESELHAVFNLATLFVMPTREHEMFGMAAVEAQACGLPVVATDHGGLRETVPDTCGVRVPPGSPKALAEAVKQLLREPAAVGRYRAQALLHARQYAWSEIARSAEEAYLAAGRTSSQGRALQSPDCSTGRKAASERLTASS